MIHYNLRCKDGHDFDAWFRGIAAFDEEEAAGRLQCPICGTSAVQKAMMAPNVSSKTRSRGQQDGAIQASSSDGCQTNDQDTSLPATATPQAPPAYHALHNEMLDQIRKVRRAVEKSSEYVGPRFAEEARKMHHEETEARSIHGEATLEEAEALHDDGIDFAILPRLPEDNN